MLLCQDVCKQFLGERRSKIVRKVIGVKNIENFAKFLENFLNSVYYLESFQKGIIWDNPFNCVE